MDSNDKTLKESSNDQDHHSSSDKTLTESSNDEAHHSSSDKTPKESSIDQEHHSSNDVIDPELSSDKLEPKDDAKQSTSNSNNANRLSDREKFATEQINNIDTSPLIAKAKEALNKTCDDSAVDGPSGTSGIDRGHHQSTSTQAASKSSSDDGCGPNCMQFCKIKSKIVKRQYRTKSNDSEEVVTNTLKRARNDRTSSSDESSPVDENDSSDVEIDNDEEDVFSNDDSDDQRGVRTSTERDEDSDESSGYTIHNMKPQVMKKDKPKPKWFVVPDLFNRAMGNNHTFDRKYYGSLGAVQRLELRQYLLGHEGCVNALHFNEAGNLIASASDDTKVIIWDWARGKALNTYSTGHTMNIFEVKWLPLDHESMVVSCSRDGNIRLLDLRVNFHRKLSSHHQEARRLAVHPDHPCGVSSVGDDGKVIYIDIRASNPTKLVRVKESGVNISLYSIHINPRNSNEFCVAGRSPYVKIYDRRRYHEPIQQKAPDVLASSKGDTYVTSAIYNYNGTEILASYNDDDIYLFDTVSSNPTQDFAHRYEGHRNYATIKSVNFFGPKSEFIISGSDCGNIYVWDKNTEAIVQWMPGDEKTVNRLECHPSVPVLATSGFEYSVKIWMPSGDGSLNVEDLESCIRRNNRNRNDDKSNYGRTSYNTEVLMFYLRRIRQYGQRNLNSRSRGNLQTMLVADSASSSSDSESDQSDGNRTRLRCLTS